MEAQEGDLLISYKKDKQQRAVIRLDEGKSYQLSVHVYACRRIHIGGAIFWVTYLLLAWGLAHPQKPFHQNLSSPQSAFETSFQDPQLPINACLCADSGATSRGERKTSRFSPGERHFVPFSGSDLALCRAPCAFKNVYRVCEYC